MDELKHWTVILLESYTHLIDGIIFALPRLLGGVLLFLVGWIIARLASRLVGKALRALRFDRLMDRVQVGHFLKRSKINERPSDIVGKFIYWLILLLIFVGFAEAMQLAIVSQKIGILINYIPNIILAALILIAGFYFASRIREFMQTSLSSYAIRSGRMIGSMIFYVIAAFVVLTALEQLQFNIDLLTSNVMILLGGIALAFAIGYGLAAKEIFPNIISSYYSKGMFQVGDRIQTADEEGEIMEITNISVVIKTEKGRKFIPAKKLVIESVEVVDRV